MKNGTNATELVNGLPINDLRRSGSGENVLLLHPLGLGADSWTRAIDKLPCSIRPITYDRRDTTSSNRASRLWRLDDHADDIEDIRRKLGL